MLPSLSLLLSHVSSLDLPLPSLLNFLSPPSQLLVFFDNMVEADNRVTLEEMILGFRTIRREWASVKAESAGRAALAKVLRLMGRAGMSLEDWFKFMDSSQVRARRKLESIRLSKLLTCQDEESFSWSCGRRLLGGVESDETRSVEGSGGPTDAKREGNACSTVVRLRKGGKQVYS